MPRSLAPTLEAIADRVMPATLLAEVQRAWPEVAGPVLGSAAAPVSERDGVVVVSCGSAVWAQELDLMGERVVRALNEALGRDAVRGIRADARPPGRG